MEKITESPSPYRNLEKMSVDQILHLINDEDMKVAQAVNIAIPQIANLVEAVSDALLAGGRMFYIGAGTSGRLGVMDAAECVPTFGVEPGLVNAIIAGGSEAFISPVEFAEDDIEAGWKDLLKKDISPKDVVIGLSAGGSTPYVAGTLQQCKSQGITTAAITCNPQSLVASIADYPVEVITGPEFITGSTRMKAGTAQKMVLNMISSAVMIRLGRVEDSKMVNMQLSNQKLIDRGVRMIMEKTGEADYEKARRMLLEHGSVKKAVENYRL